MTLRRLPLVLLLAVALLGAAACSSDDDDGATAGADEASAAPVADTAADAGAADGSGGSSASSEGDDPENPWVFGYEVDGPAGTTAVVVAKLVAIGEEQGPVSATWSITDRPRWQLFTNWIGSGELEIEVTEGGPATVTTFRARYIDVNDPFAGIEVDEQLGEVEVTAGASATLDLP